MTVRTTPRRDGNPPVGPQHHLMLLVLFAGQVMAAMDTAIANVAGPSLQRSLGASGAMLQLIISGYVVSYAVLLVTGARLGSQYGFRRMYLLGTSIFTAASLVCGLAPEPYTLIVARVMQGVGAAIMVPQVLSTIQHTLQGHDRTRAVAYYSVILAVGAASGQLLGGAVTTLNLFGLAWRPAFLINVPIGILILAIAPRVLPHGKGDGSARFDVPGIAVLSSAILAIVIPLTFGRETGWPTWAFASLAFGLLGLVVFVWLEQVTAQRAGAPLLNMAVFAPGVGAGLVVIFLGFTGYGGLLFSVANYAQMGLGFSAIESGMLFMCTAAGFGLANIGWSRLPPRFLRWAPPAGAALFATANLLLAVGCYQRGWSAALFVPLLFLSGLGQGISYGTTVSKLTGLVPSPHSPALSGLVVTSTQLAIVLGIAGFGGLYLAKAETPHTGLALVAAAISLAGLCALVAALMLAKAKGQAK